MSSSSSSSAAAAALNGKAQEQQQKMMNMNMNMKKKMMKKLKNSNSNGGGGGGGGRMRWSAEELIKQYEESEGLDTKQASIKVINDLQKAIFRLITTSKQQQPQHLDLIHSRLLRLDMKLDSKPGYPHILGLGVASAATYRTLETLAFPQLASAFANIWNAVRSTTNTNPNN